MAFSDFGLALHGAALGRPADPTSLANAAAASTEGQTLTLPFCQARFEQPSGGSPPRRLDRLVPITPQTVAGGAPKLGYSLLHHGALAAHRSAAALAEFRDVSGDAAATGFDPCIGVMQAQASLAGDFASLGFHDGSRVAAGLGSRMAMFLAGVLEASLHAVTFRLV